MVEAEAISVHAKSSLEARSQVAAAAAAVIPFHCIICFDEFTLTDRPPVVLPCGHTYVCQPCSKRLKRCMECREPLFLPAPAPKTPPTAQRAAPPMYNRGGRYSPQPSTPPQGPIFPASSPPAPVALPIPKNVVLLAMMEAVQRQAKEAESEALGNESSNEEPGEDEEEFDLNRIISGMATLSGPCGTYAVKEPDGLAVVPLDPRKNQHCPSEDEDEKKSEKDPEGEPKEPFSVERGQTVQVVDFDDGVAKLARGEGYIVATRSQLVKVGEPKDKSCRLEGLLDTVASRGQDLQRTLDENQEIEANLRRQILAERELEPTHPIITELPKQEDPTTPKSYDPLEQPYLGTPESPARDVFILQANSLEVESAVDENGTTIVASPSPKSIDNSDLSGRRGLPTYRRNNSSDDLQQMAFGCGAAFFGANTDLLGEGLSNGTTSGVLGRLVAPSVETSGDTAENNENRRSDTLERQQSQARSEQQWLHSTPVLTSSFDTIDFRTGMSGHRGLSNKTSHGMSPSSRGQVRMMSVHSGIGRMRGPSRNRSSDETTLGPRFLPMIQGKGSGD